MRLMMLYKLGIIGMSVMIWIGQAFQSMNGQKRPGSWNAQPRRTTVDRTSFGVGGENSGLGGGSGGGSSSFGKMNNDNNDGDDKERDVKIVTSSSEEGKRWKRLGNWAGTFWEDQFWGTLAKFGAVFALYNLIKDDFTKDLKDELKNTVKTETLTSEIQLLRRDLFIVFLLNSFVTLAASGGVVRAVKK
uniref:Uncharacterized protein n=1 Tax=Aureoumbra lagunensis TaxID=44058 RepID=A0A7S3K2S2_9STRA